VGAAVPRAYALGYYLSPLPGLLRINSRIIVEIEWPGHDSKAAVLLPHSKVERMPAGPLITAPP